MVAVMIAPIIGVNPFTPGFIVLVAFIAAISSIGISQVGGGAFLASIMVLAALNLPVAFAGLFICVGPLIDMGRTAVNVCGSIVAGLATERITKQVNSHKY